MDKSFKFGVKSHPMDVSQFMVLAVIGIAAGLLSGFMGVGGGIVIVPALVYFMGMSQHGAQGSSIAAIMLLPVGVFSVLNYYREGHVNFVYSGIIALFFVVGSYAGSKWVQGIDASLLKKIFASLMIGIAVKILLEKK